MSQIEIMIIMHELGDRATGPAIVKRAKEKFPNLSLWTYVNTRLARMRKRGLVGRDNKTGEFYIIDPSPMYNRNIVELK